MSTVRLYYPENITENSTSLLSKEHTHYIVNVMRLKRGSKINFFNKEGEWLSEIVFLDRDRVEIKFLNKIKESFPASNIELAICLVKKNPMEIILQKATELGVSRIIPIISERTEVKDLNLERANKITIEATEQSNQLNPPKISQMIDLKDFINSISKETKLFFADINSKHTPSLKDIEGIKNISILIGPEGDFSPSERELILKKSNVIPFSLSKNILRTDTAVISAISLVNFINNNH
ncbi:MAG: 16S rRNA (uracil(1498)-N(3))-methyltransferase [Pelagibacteraceae bacterium]|nr:16S rRNA (uracil(1498)-N(3))-methyltransferase [Pelagibacteraceae bacterium]